MILGRKIGTIILCWKIAISPEPNLRWTSDQSINSSLSIVVQYGLVWALTFSLLPLTSLGSACQTSPGPHIFIIYTHLFILDCMWLVWDLIFSQLPQTSLMESSILGDPSSNYRPLPSILNYTPFCLKSPLSNLNSACLTFFSTSPFKIMGYLTQNVFKIAGFPTKCSQVPLAPLAEFSRSSIEGYRLVWPALPRIVWGKSENMMSQCINKYGTQTGVAELRFDQSKYSLSFQMIVNYR